MRRVSLALLGSLAIHLTIALATVGYAAWRGLSLGRGLELVPITLEEIKELPLGPPPGAEPEGDDKGESAPRPRRRSKPRSPRPDGTLIAGGPDAGAAPTADARPAPTTEIAEGTVKKGDLRGYGPEGSRLTALLRLDRLRASTEARAYIAAVDEILRLLPDRRRLLDGTGLDLYRDFDALLIATPNPFDDTVTFLAARHRLGDPELRAALDRGAALGGRTVEWREEAGRPVGVRQSRPGAPPDRDDRLFVLPKPGLAVIAPPAYAQLLLDNMGPRPDAGAPDAGAPAGRKLSWADLVARIDAEDGAMPEDAVFLLTATNILRAAEERPHPAAAGAVLPKVLSLVAGTTPTTFLEITAEFGAEEQARRWETEWPTWRRKLLGNPLVLLAGLNPIVSRAELRREERTVFLRTTASTEETRRVLQMIVNFARPGGSAP